MLAIVEQSICKLICQQKGKYHMQQDHHIIRRKYALHIAKMESIMANGNYGSADNYYWYKDKERELAAQLSGADPRKYDPMYFWYGRQSN
jgi:hypothetical protein